ncbi:MAG: PP2C family protein-serine/threonine phosphatase [Planctomycetota bacterium]
MQVLLVDPETSLPRGMATCLAEDGWTVSTTADYKRATELTHQDHLAAVVVPQPKAGLADASVESDYRNLIRALDARRIAAVLLTDTPGRRNGRDGTLIDVAGREITKEELRGRLATIRRYHALVRRMEQEVANLQRIGKRLNQHFNEVEQEMRLAGRLQRDFLPRCVGPVGPARFAPLYRPVAWVSGDIYDIFRIDERHVGFYVADAAGHGMAASLLTMFIKHAMSGKETTPGGYRIREPSETLTNLNEALTEQDLPNCQFVTACYCVLNTETLELQFARGGHPYPLLITRDGQITELKSQGGLMGLFKGAAFPTAKIQMHPGDKLILYTDGIEVSFAPGDNEARSWEHYRSVFENLAHEPIEEIVRQLEALLNAETGSLHLKDDVTIVGMQIHTEQ